MTSKELKEQQRRNLAKVRTPESQRQRRLVQIASEEAMAGKMREEGWEIYSPTVVCDRIGVKDGKVFFVEFKQNGQQLRAGQARVQSLMPDNYLIRFTK